MATPVIISGIFLFHLATPLLLEQYLSKETRHLHVLFLTSDTAYAYIIRSGDPYMVGAIKSEQDVVVLDTVEQHFCNSSVLLMIDLSVGAVQV